MKSWRTLGMGLPALGLEKEIEALEEERGEVRLVGRCGLHGGLLSCTRVAGGEVRRG